MASLISKLEPHDPGRIITTHEIDGWRTYYVNNDIWGPIDAGIGLQDYDEAAQRHTKLLRSHVATMRLRDDA